MDGSSFAIEYLDQVALKEESTWKAGQSPFIWILNSLKLPDLFVHTFFGNNCCGAIVPE